MIATAQAIAAVRQGTSAVDVLESCAVAHDAICAAKELKEDNVADVRESFSQTNLES